MDKSVSNSIGATAPGAALGASLRRNIWHKTSLIAVARRSWWRLALLFLFIFITLGAAHWWVAVLVTVGTAFLIPVYATFRVSQTARRIETMQAAPGYQPAPVVRVGGWIVLLDRPRTPNSWRAMETLNRSIAEAMRLQPDNPQGAHEEIYLGPDGNEWQRIWIWKPDKDTPAQAAPR